MSDPGAPADDLYKLPEIGPDGVWNIDPVDVQTMPWVGTKMPKPVDQIAALLKGVNLELPSDYTDEQILNRVYRHFGGAACRFDNRDWVSFVRDLIEGND